MLIVVDDSFSTTETCKGDGSFCMVWTPIIKTLSISPDAFARIFRGRILVQPGFSVTRVSTSRDTRKCSVHGQIEPAGVTGGKSFSGSNTLLKKFVSEYIATSATISITFASV